MKPRNALPMILLSALCAAATPAKPDAGEILDITWELGPNLPEFRKGSCATVLDGNVISVFGMRQPWGEMDTMYVFDPKANWWFRGTSGPIGQAYGQGTECGEAFYAIGGRNRGKGGVHTECYRLRHEDGGYVWDRVSPLNEKRAWAPSASVAGKLFVFGGAQGGHGPTLSSVEMLDTNSSAPSWQKVGEIPGASRGWCGAAAIGDMIYLVGGAHFFDPKPADGPDRKLLDEVWQFDPATCGWESKKPLPFRLSGFDCCVYQDRYLIVAGGAPVIGDFTVEMSRIQQQDRFYRSYYNPFVIVYDTASDQWRRLPSVLPMPTNDLQLVILNDRLYALGGENVEPATSNTTPWLRIGTIQTGKQ